MIGPAFPPPPGSFAGEESERPRAAAPHGENTTARRTPPPDTPMPKQHAEGPWFVPEGRGKFERKALAKKVRKQPTKKAPFDCDDFARLKTRKACLAQGPTCHTIWGTTVAGVSSQCERCGAARRLPQPRQTTKEKKAAAAKRAAAKRAAAKAAAPAKKKAARKKKPAHETPTLRSSDPRYRPLLVGDDVPSGRTERAARILAQLRSEGSSADWPLN